MRNGQSKQMKLGFNPQFSEMKTGRKREKEREAVECTAKLKTNETNLFQSPGNVEASSSQRNARTHTHAKQNVWVGAKEKRESDVEGMRKLREKENIKDMLCACRSIVIFSPQLRSHLLFHI